jgi:hypothetical protein
MYTHNTAASPTLTQVNWDLNTSAEVTAYSAGYAAMRSTCGARRALRGDADDTSDTDAGTTAATAVVGDDGTVRYLRADAPQN